MKRLNWRTLTTEPCFWVKTSTEGEIESLAVAYVDDFMIGVNEESPHQPETLHRFESPLRMGRMGI